MNPLSQNGIENAVKRIGALAATALYVQRPTIDSHALKNRDIKAINPKKQRKEVKYWKCSYFCNQSFFFTAAKAASPVTAEIFEDLGILIIRVFSSLLTICEFEGEKKTKYDFKKRI